VFYYTILFAGAQVSYAKDDMRVRSALWGDRLLKNKAVAWFTPASCSYCE
jgi:hypothetical protein